MKLVINVCFGGFGLSQQAEDRYAELTNLGKLYRYNWEDEPVKATDSFWHATTKENDLADKYYFNSRDIPRDDPALVLAVEELKEKASGHCAKLKVVTIPDDTDYVIEEHDGREYVAERRKTWS